MTKAPTERPRDYHRPPHTRGVVVTVCIAATLGLVLLGLFGPYRLALLNPGPLSSAHAQAMNQGTTADTCVACHDAAEADPLSWLLIASGRVHEVSAGQATRCLACHAQTMNRELALTPHNVPVEALHAATRRISAESHGLDDVLRVKRTSSETIGCATCHKEHLSGHANLTDLTEQQCQACHVQAFESFEQGHPEFRRTLPSRRSHIAFDHVSHASKHFAGKQRTFVCTDCHESDARRDVMRLKGFGQSCAQCHTAPIEAATLEGLVAFQFPTIDVARLESGGHPVGDWPPQAQGDFDGELPPLVRTLLLADDRVAAAQERLGMDFDFSKVEPHDDLRSVAELVWAYKRLLNDLANDSEGTLRARLTAGEIQNEAYPLVQQVARQIPPALFREARRRWLPNLEAELQEHAPGAPLAETDNAILPQVRMDQGDLLAENPLAGNKKLVRSGDVPGITWWTKADQISPSPQPIAQPAPSPSSIAPKAGDSELLAENPLSKRQSPRNVVDVPTAALPTAQPEHKDEPKTEATVPAVGDPLAMASEGTWFLDEATLSVRYRTRGHADELLRVLIDVAAARTSHHVPRQSLLPMVLEAMAAKSCASCHSIDTHGDGYAVNWQVQYRETARRHFTEFSHRPHLAQPSLAGCVECHRLNERSDVLSNFETTDPMIHAHDFQPLGKANCAACHQRAETGGRCTLCHSYHVGAQRGD
jgi:hypothetical protein